MPFAGLGLHFLLALFCAFHVVRTRRQLYWLFILFAFPLLGSLVYFFMVYLPNSRLERGAMKAVAATARTIDPMKEVRRARTDF
ncbi:PLDc N-terminal domain-containing protein [Variovorax rhizosphaerae]|uniref:PLDc N-terminal domain-containing protein n=1 Tax=Variovorax rhizosphaerae TaxID=1836200 RepID=A0ABU8WUQ3_9BURK